MQVTSIKRTLLFQELGNVTMTANVEPGDDVLEVQKYLEDLMVEGVQRYSRGEDTAGGGTCRACGCTDDHACEGGCYWVEGDLCSRCATVEISDRLQAELKRCVELRDTVGCSESDLRVMQEGAASLVEGQFEPMRDALARLQLVGAAAPIDGEKLLIDLRERLEDEIERCRKLIDNYQAIPAGACVACLIRIDVAAAESVLESGEVKDIELALEALRGVE